jgi:hypothetical protein
MLAAASAITVIADGPPTADALRTISGREKKPHNQTVLVSPPLTGAEAQALVHLLD